MIPPSTLTRRAAVVVAALVAAAPGAEAKKKPKPPLVSAQAFTTNIVPNEQGTPGFLARVAVVAFRLADDPAVFLRDEFTIFLPGALRADARRARLADQLRILVGGRLGVAPDRVDVGLL